MSLTSAPSKLHQPQVSMAPPTDPRRSSSGHGGQVAREVIKTPPGTYRAPVLHVPGSSGAAGRPLVAVTFPPRPGPPPLSASIVLHDGMGEELLKRYPGFPLPFSSPSPARYTIVDVGPAGAGMIALDDIIPGQTIARERPLLLQPHTMRITPS